MVTAMFWATMAFAAVDWVGSWRGWRSLRYISKPLTLVLLIVWFTQVGGWKGNLLWFGLGLFFSLAGDVLLHLPARFFLAGVAAFFMAHLAYIAGFLQPLPLLDARLLFLVLPVCVVFVLLNRRIRKGLRDRRETDMIIPVTLYALILSTMLLLAISTLLNPAWARLPAIIVSLGAGLFFISDSVLAYSRFVRDLPHSDCFVMITYHLGQILLTAGVLVQYAGLR